MKGCFTDYGKINSFYDDEFKIKIAAYW